MPRPFGMGGGGGGGRRRAEQQNQGLRQSVNANYNWSHAASDNVEHLPQLGGKTSSGLNSLQAATPLGVSEIYQCVERELEPVRYQCDQLLYQ